MTPAEAILTLCHRRGAGKTICPSEAARLLGEDWRAEMDAVRDAAALLARQGEIHITQKGHPVAPGEISGPVRLGLVPGAKPRGRMAEPS
ncbi:MAG: DUF3253 domain-containing protein [Pseudomonadota bacterium]